MWNKLLLFFLLTNVAVYGQTDSIAHRIILIGDAGEINTKQHALVEKASELVLADKTTAFFLGDNIYPYGMPLDTLDQEKEGRILKSQYGPFRNEGVPVYFMAGNHDWDNSRALGFEKVLAQEAFLKKQHDSLLFFIPKAGTAGPKMVQIEDSLVAIVYDSEYWLFPHHQISKVELDQQWDVFVNQMDSLLQVNRGKTVLLLSHHPMLSYGEHGLRFSWKHHIFPLTTRWKKLYIPLPGIGSLFPLLRTTVFRSAEDLPHPDYKKLRKKILKLTQEQRKILFISGHDHGLQYIDSSEARQVVSGSGAKINAMTKGKQLVYGHEGQGFSTIDLMHTGDIILRFYTYENANVELSFETAVFLN